jgi:hypothetical protein
MRRKEDAKFEEAFDKRWNMSGIVQITYLVSILVAYQGNMPGRGFEPTIISTVGGNRVGSRDPNSTEDAWMGSPEAEIPAAAKAFRTKFTSGSLLPRIVSPTTSTPSYVLLPETIFQLSNPFDICIAKNSASGSLATYVSLSEDCLPERASCNVRIWTSDNVLHSTRDWICAVFSRASSARSLAVAIATFDSAWNRLRSSCRAVANLPEKYQATKPAEAARIVNNTANPPLQLAKVSISFDDIRLGIAGFGICVFLGGGAFVMAVKVRAYLVEKPSKLPEPIGGNTLRLVLVGFEYGF